MTPSRFWRDAAAVQIFVTIVYLTDVVTAFAAGARWFTPRIFFPSIGLPLAAGWLAFALAFRAQRRVPIALTILTFTGVFFLWTYRLGYWPSIHTARWIAATLAIVAVPLIVSRVRPSHVMIAVPPAVVVYQIAKVITIAAAATTLRRELPAIVIAIVMALVVALVVAIAARISFIERPQLQRAFAAITLALAGIGVIAMVAWSGRSFSVVTQGSEVRVRAQPNAPNIVMVVIDTLRADRLGMYGYRTRPTSPFIDSLAARAGVYRNAYATTSWTVPSIATMFTGLAPEAHGVVVFGAQLPAVPTLAERLHARGYATTAVVSNYLIDADHGFARGFDRFALLYRINSQTGEPSPLWIDALLVGHYWLPNLIASGTPKPAAESVVDETLHAIEGAPRNHPLFVYMHFLDPHHPCDAPPNAATNDWQPAASDRALDAAWSVAYDREVRYVDDQLARFFRNAKLGANTLYVIVADHGEELGERGKRGHGSNLDEAVVRVPLIVIRPNSRALAVDEPFSLTHLADLIESAATARDDIVRAHLIPPPLPETTMTSVQRNGWKLVTTDAGSLHREQLFHLPDETRNELEQQPQIASALRASRDLVPHITAPPITDPELRAKMRALGYIH
jgi:hypothetical protein